MAAQQPNFNQVSEAFQTIANQMGLVQNIPAIQGQQQLAQQLTAQLASLAAQVTALTAQVTGELEADFSHLSSCSLELILAFQRRCSPLSNSQS
jgi:hypothetical protein